MESDEAQRLTGNTMGATGGAAAPPSVAAPVASAPPHVTSGIAPPSPGGSIPAPPAGQIAPVNDSAPKSGANRPGGGQASPERQQLFDRLVENTMEWLYPEQGGVQPAVLQQLEAGGNPVQAVGNIAGKVVAGQVASARGAGVDIDQSVIANAMREVVGLLTEVAENAMGEDIPDEALTESYRAAVGAYGQEAKESLGQGGQPEVAMSPPGGDGLQMPAGPPPGIAPGAAPATPPPPGAIA